MRLLLVRHGQTQANTEWRLSGWTDDPLDDLGQRQARAIGRHLAAEGNVAAIYASTLRRARRTAEAIAAALGGRPIIEREQLRERNFGVFESLVAHSLADHWPELAGPWAERGDIDWGPPKGETPQEFVARIMHELNGIVAAHAADDRVVVVTHGGVIAAAMATWLDNEPSRWREYFVRNCSVTELEFRSAPRLVRFNECVEPEEAE